MSLQGRASSPMALQSALEAAKAALPQLLDTQNKLAEQHASTTTPAVPRPEFYAGCDPAAAASIIAAAKPRVAKIFSDSNSDMSRVQRDAALRLAKEEVIQELTKSGIYRFSVSPPQNVMHVADTAGLSHPFLQSF